MLQHSSFSHNNSIQEFFQAGHAISGVQVTFLSFLGQKIIGTCHTQSFNLSGKVKSYFNVVIDVSALANSKL